MKPWLGKTPTGQIVHIDVDRLLETRLVLTAISGGGKSHACRRILEQTHARAQHLIIDPEGEFYTLREDYGYVLAGGRGGDCAVDVRTAPLLAQRLLELRVSAILDLYSLPADPAHPQGRVRWVKAFLEALLSVPQHLYTPCFVVIDEAHKFCPERGEGEASSTGSVISLMSDGRKKRLCGILATQRISKLHKSAVAEAHNLMIGKATLDLDVQRAARSLGFVKAQELSIRRMPRGHFWTAGPAFCDDVTDVLVGATNTQSPKFGSKQTPPAAPTAAIAKVLSKLSDIPAVVEQREQTLELLKAENLRLTQELRDLKKGPSASELESSRRKFRAELDREMIAAAQTAAQQTAIAFHKALEPALNQAPAILERLLLQYTGVTETTPRPVVSPAPPRSFPDSVSHSSETPVEMKATPSPSGDPGKPMAPAERRVLTALAQHGPVQDMARLAALSGYSVTGHFSNILSALRTRGWMSAARVAPLEITHLGRVALGDYEPLPEGAALRLYWLQRVSPSERKILSVLIDRYPATLSSEELAQAAGYSVTGHFSNMLSSLRTLGLITPARQPIAAAAVLFES